MKNFGLCLVLLGAVSCVPACVSATSRPAASPPDDSAPELRRLPPIQHEKPLRDADPTDSAPSLLEQPIDFWGEANWRSKGKISIEWQQ